MKLASSVTMAPAIILPRANLRIRTCVARACAITQLRAARLSLTERGAVATFLQKYKNRFSSFLKKWKFLESSCLRGKELSLSFFLFGEIYCRKSCTLVATNEKEALAWRLFKTWESCKISKNGLQKMSYFQSKKNFAPNRKKQTQVNHANLKSKRANFPLSQGLVTVAGLS